MKYIVKYIKNIIYIKYDIKQNIWKIRYIK